MSEQAESMTCTRCGKAGERMSERPFRGELGEKVWAHVCPTCWRDWVGAGTMLINEMGLRLAEPAGQRVYDEHMVEFLHLPK